MSQVLHVLRLTRWELFKLQRRRLPWVLLGIAVAISQLFLWGAYFTYHNSAIRSVLVNPSSSTISGTATVDGQEVPVSVEVTCFNAFDDDLPPEAAALSERDQMAVREAMEELQGQCGNPEDIQFVSDTENWRSGFTLPASLADENGDGLPFYIMLVMVLAASAMGAEYAWGTLRTTITKGSGRWQLITAKFLTMLLASAGALVALGAITAAASLLAHVIPPSEEGGVADAGEWLGVATTFARTLYGLAPFIALATFLAVFSSSTAVGVAVGLGYYFGELILRGILGGFFDWFRHVSPYLLGEASGDWASQGFSDGVRPFLVVLAYAVVLVAATVYIFQKRDIGGAKGS